MDGSPYDAHPSAVDGMRSPRLDVDRLPPSIVRELRASHVGETVAVGIYDGVVAATGDPGMRAFARGHRDVEAHHLALFEALLPLARRSRLMGFWRLCGWLMGWLPARIGPAAFYAVVADVERWVDGHYARQIELVRQVAPHPALLDLLDACRADELQHSRDAEALLPRRPLAARVLAWIAVAGSKTGVAVARRI